MANSQNLRPPFNSETGRENQKKSVAKRKENQSKNQGVRETVKAMLKMPVTDKKQLETIKKSGLPVGNKPTYMDFICASAVVQTANKGKLDDLIKLMAIIGEDMDNTDSAVLAKAAELLGGVDSAID